MASFPTVGPIPISSGNGLAGSLAGDALNGIASALSSAAGDLVRALFSTLSGATAITPTAPWFSGGASSPVGLVAAIAGASLLGLFIAQVGRSVVRGEAGGFVRALTGLTKAVFGTAIFLGVLTVVLELTDDACTYVLGASNLGPAASNLLTTGLALSGVDAFVAIILAALIVGAALFLYGMLLVRTVAIYVVAAIGPVIMAGQVHDRTRSWLPRWIDVLFALVMSKLALCLVFVVGMDLLGQLSGLSGAIEGLMLVGLAAYSPWGVAKLFHSVGLGEAMLAAGAIKESPLGQPIAASTNAMGTAGRVQGFMASMSGGAGAAGAATSAATAATAATSAVAGDGSPGSSAGGGSPEPGAGGGPDPSSGGPGGGVGTAASASTGAGETVPPSPSAATEATGVRVTSEEGGPPAVAVPSSPSRTEEGDA